MIKSHHTGDISPKQHNNISRDTKQRVLGIQLARYSKS